jgi:hypothetical protein
MITTETMHGTDRNDAELVAESLGGSREAFRQIVERYQTLICSLAYSATRNVSRSEDVAQETLLTAWKELRSLRTTVSACGLCTRRRARIPYRFHCGP